MTNNYQSVAVVIPAYNEAQLVASTIDKVPDVATLIVVVDDASQDDTANVVRASTDTRVVLLQHDANKGAGAAIATGYAHAFEQGADVAVVMAGDGQMDPRDLPALLEPIRSGQAGYVKGNRLAWPGVHRKMPLLRWIGNLVLSWLTRLSTGLVIHDSQCGYTAMTQTTARAVDLTSLWPGYGYPNDLLCRLARAGVAIADVPVRPVYGSEASGVRWWHAVWTVPSILARGMRQR